MLGKWEGGSSGRTDQGQQRKQQRDGERVGRYKIGDVVGGRNGGHHLAVRCKGVSESSTANSNSNDGKTWPTAQPKSQHRHGPQPTQVPAQAMATNKREQLGETAEGHARVEVCQQKPGQQGRGVADHGTVLGRAQGRAQHRVQKLLHDKLR